MRALIIGGGPAGLATALALRNGGMAATVYERRAAPDPVGTALTLWPNAMSALRLLGVADEVAAVAQPCDGTQIRRWDGVLLSRTPGAELVARYGWPGVTLYRADLIGVLRAALPADAVRWATTLVDHRVGVTDVTADFADGSRESASLLVGADGIRSPVRARLLDRSGDLRPCGYVVFRGIADLSTEGAPGLMVMGRGAQFGAFPLPAGRTYWFASLPDALAAQVPEASLAWLRRYYRAWCDPVPRLIAATPPDWVVRTPISDRAPLRRWHDDRVVLVGDAAHPSAPTLGQGTCQAIEDAVVLGECLRGGGPLPPALARFTSLRRGRVAGVTRQAHWMGVLGRWRNPVACALRDGITTHLPRRLQDLQLDQMFTFRAGRISRPSRR
ncbi:FAD-dependent monooxygenase [Micromonospora sonneratiae]|uniref:FAD-dependent monooxygenase n=1 Tax=Micromonospora sonneratiae TaxID=1184706 RepID=A0ABW3YIM8_9ACTN